MIEHAIASGQKALIVLDGTQSPVKITQGGESRLELVIAAVEGGIDLECEVELQAPGAELVMNGVMLGDGDERVNVKLKVSHLKENCHSDMRMRGIAAGQAIARFQGLVYVAPGAQRTNAYMNSRNLLIGEKSRVYTEPHLEIYADDVKCSHGATVGQLDPQALFYMRQRGLSEASARRLQLEGLVGEVLDKCPEGAQCQSLHAAAQAKISRM